MYKLGYDKVGFTLGELGVAGAGIPLAFAGRHLASPPSEESPTASKVLSHGATVPASLIGSWAGGLGTLTLTKLIRRGRGPSGYNHLLDNVVPALGMLGGASLGGAGAGLLARIGRKQPAESPSEAINV